jgi:hypothetical protein
MRRPFFVAQQRMSLSPNGGKAAVTRIGYKDMRLAQRSVDVAIAKRRLSAGVRHFLSLLYLHFIYTSKTNVSRG